MAKLVSKTYGEALFEVAVEEGTIDSLMEETEAVLAIFQENEEYVKLLNHPKITVEEKVSMLKEAFAGKVSDQLTGLLTTVVEKGRFAEIENILSYFQEQVREYKKIGTAVVTSAVSLTQDEKDSIEDKLLKTTSYKSFRMQYSVDESLIGGIIIQIGDRVVDSSIRTKLANMAKDLSKIQLAK
ncbi:MAG: F0F1 ATP synthase subunit delta [Butyribacter sp.]|nr:F0F1 ATP synthase subunit delta [bacterium]MDY3854532.1 F0F1 ATP synthase subunit delta [Butyribacter sp.]